MRRCGVSEEQIIGIPKEHQAGPGTTELGRKHGISDATFCKWRSKYGGMEGPEAKRLKQLEGEAERAAFQWKDPPPNERHAEEAVGGGHDGRIHASREAGKKRLRPGARRSAVTWAMSEKRCSQRRACRLVGIDPRVHRYRPSRPDDVGLRGQAAGASARVGVGETALRGSPVAPAGRAGGDRGEVEEALPALP